jgi:hypothetical protein
MADVFGGDIDFYQDLRRGDRFTVVYEVRYIDGEPVGVGAIVAAEFENRGQALRAFLWRGEDGGEYYFADAELPTAVVSLGDGVPRVGVFSNARLHRSANGRAQASIMFPTERPARHRGVRVVCRQQDGYGNGSARHGRIFDSTRISRSSRRR